MNENRHAMLDPRGKQKNFNSFCTWDKQQPEAGRILLCFMLCYQMQYKNYNTINVQLQFLDIPKLLLWANKGCRTFNDVHKLKTYFQLLQKKIQATRNISNISVI
jgi:hypothetical protein